MILFDLLSMTLELQENPDLQPIQLTQTTQPTQFTQLDQILDVEGNQRKTKIEHFIIDVVRYHTDPSAIEFLSKQTTKIERISNTMYYRVWVYCRGKRLGYRIISESDLFLLRNMIPTQDRMGSTQPTVHKYPRSIPSLPSIPSYDQNITRSEEMNRILQSCKETDKYVF
jgi:hypothetical protein